MTGNHESIRQFYQQKLEEHDYTLSAVRDSWKDAQIGRLELLISRDSADFDTVEIESISQEVPALIQSAFERHTWFSQHCLSDVYVVAVPVEARMSYALLVLGYVSDGWDGFCQLIEVFDEAGNFVGAADCSKDFVWLDQTFDGDVFPGSQSCHWTGNTDTDEMALWSIKKASHIEKSGSKTWLVMPWAGCME